MQDRIWVNDNEPSATFPIYTRGNVGEVFPEAVAPLSWTLGAVPGSEPGWRDALVRFGSFDHDEFDQDEICLLGCFGGYAYLNVSLTRINAVRTPGLTPEIMDQTLFGTSDAPPYAARPGDESPEHTTRIEATIAWVLSTEDLPELRDDQARVEAVVAARADASGLSDRQLLEKAHEHMGLFRDLFSRHIFISYCSTVPLAVLQQVANEMGDPTMPMKLVAGVGGVDSAAPSFVLWDLGRDVVASQALTAAFNMGVDGLLSRIRALPERESGAWLADFAAFLDRFGSRGPNEWEMRAPTWGTHPELVLAAIDRMRLAPDSAAPASHHAERAAEREGMVAFLGEALESMPEARAQVLAACSAAGLFLAGRERSKTTVIGLVHEARLLFHELGRRMVDAGWFDQVEDFGMLTADEWDQFLDKPEPFVDVIRERNALYTKLASLEPPFIIDGKVPPLSEWQPRGGTTVAPARTGDVLTGIPGCAGTCTGRARVILDPEHPGALEPGDILIAPITDPAWTPLFVPAGAVVVDVGAQISHAVIVSRELGIPCVVSVTDATRRIPDGALITVDGTNGTVTLN